LKGEVANPAPNIFMNEILEEHDQATTGYDAMIVINGSLNLYGGADSPESILPWRMINRFPGRVFYLMCDPELPLKQVWEAVRPERRPTWTNRYQEDDIVIKRCDMVLVSQSQNLDVVEKEVLAKQGVDFERIVQFSFEKFPCMREIPEPNEAPEYDLIYGGTMRGNRREKKMVQYYFDLPEGMRGLMFGKIRVEDFKEKLVAGKRVPEFSGYVKYDAMLEHLNKSLAHVVIGDPLYERLNLIGQRTYESIWAGCVTFIDKELDKKRSVFGKNQELSDFLYVSSQAEVIDRIEALKCDTEMRFDILAEQYETVGFDPTAYTDDLTNLLKDNL